MCKVYVAEEYYIESKHVIVYTLNCAEDSEVNERSVARAAGRARFIFFITKWLKPSDWLGLGGGGVVRGEARLITVLSDVCLWSAAVVFGRIGSDEHFRQRRAKLKKRPNLLNIDCELLIVKERKQIRSIDHPQHFNRQILRKLWIEIRTIFNYVQVPILKRKWKNLKDRFHKEVKK